MTIVWFNEIGLNDIYLVGGKGANLGAMARAGLPVPPGFCVTTEAYKQFIAEMHLWREMEHWLATLDAREACEQIRQRIGNCAMPQTIRASIQSAYTQLNNGHAPVAVRSSATAEDLADASFAGQQETYLGIRGADNLANAVQRCWASLWTERAIAYRARNNFPHDQVSLSVVVQEMIAPDVAGVLFTANPVTNDLDEMIINASFGLGESVVSGRVTPDTYRVRRKKFTVLEQACGTKDTRIDMAHDNGTVETVVDDAARQRLCLDHSALRRLLDLGESVEKHYGKPQDIEWGIASGQLYLLQTRPITSLTTNTPTTKSLSRLQHEIVNDLLEHYPEPPYPLDYFAVTDSYQQLANSFGDYGIALPPANQIIVLDENGIPRIVPPQVKFILRALGMLGTMQKNLKTNPNVWLNQQHAQFESELDTLAQTNVTQLDNPGLIRFIQTAVGITSRVGAIRFRDFIVPAVTRSAILKMMMGSIKEAKTISVMDLLDNLPYKTAVIDQALRQLANEAEELPEASDILLNTNMDTVIFALEQNAQGKFFLGKVNEFLREHGARTMKMYLPFSNRSWSESPATLLTTIAVLLRSHKSPAAPNSHSNDIRARVIAQIPGWLRPRFVATLEQFRIGHIARESTLYTIEQGFLQARRGVDQAAERLHTAGALPQLNLVVYLTLDELYGALKGAHSPAELSALTQRRQRARPQALKVWRAQWQAKKSEPGNATLKGLAGSSGVATGKAKIISGPAEFGKLQAGDVLVCPFTDPAWTPLFTLACAVVADTGGPLSHAAIVAREYGIPAVLGTQNATQVFKDGDQISVDGNSGTVWIATKT